MERHPVLLLEVFLLVVQRMERAEQWWVARELS